jgi:hypothetical protein
LPDYPPERRDPDHLQEHPAQAASGLTGNQPRLYLLKDAAGGDWQECDGA